MNLKEFIESWYLTHSQKANFALIKQIAGNKDLYCELNESVDKYINDIQQQLYHFIYDIKSIPKCPNCQNPLPFISLSIGYLTYCSKACKTSYDHKTGKFAEGLKKGSEKFKQIYGKDGPKHAELIRKREETCVKKFGVSHPMKDPKVVSKYMDTCIQKYGETNPMRCDNVKDKVSSTNCKIYGHSRPLQNTNVFAKMFEKYKETIKSKYNVDCVFQVPEIFERAQQNSFMYHKHGRLTYQASYEKDFIDYCENQNIIDKVSNGPFLWYEYDGKKKRYFSDFFIEELNLIIEIKSSHWYYSYKEQNDTKRKACIENGFGYIMILDKNYSEFNEYIK